jgi:DNA-binding MarR family transcriptional regulator
MTDTAPVLPPAQTQGLPPAPVSPKVQVPEDTADGAVSADADVTALLAAFRRMQLQHARVLQRESATRGLNPTDARFVFFLAAGGGASTPKQAGEHLGLTTGAMTSLMDRLEQRGHIERRPNTEDRRSIVVRLTPSGAAIAHEIGDVYRSAFREVVAPADRAALADVFGRLGAALDHRSSAVSA